MTLAELTSRDAVLAAIAEYDALGQDAFLAKYGFGLARSYLLVHDGRRYDSKAIAGVALGYQYPEHGPLRAGDFSGGAATVQRTLEQLGFTVTSNTMSDARPLVLYEDYTRAEVHAIFAPETRFTPQSGTWGLQGIIPIPNRPKDFVFFVTFGQQQGHHVFAEGITEDGVLSWQSQPRQRLQSQQIQQFIAHDELQNTIHLFLRTSDRSRYTYLGRLRYLDHDPHREQPVYFQWQILDWELSVRGAARIGLLLQPRTVPSPAADTQPTDIHQRAPLTVTPPPAPRRTQRTRVFQARGPGSDPVRDARLRALGLAGEVLVMAYEQDHLTKAGRADLAVMVRHVALVEGDGAGYDIASWTEEGAPLYIEVKTTTGAADTPFIITANELAFAAAHTNAYRLYRIFGYDQLTKTGQMYMIEGDPTSVCQVTPTAFRLMYRGSNLGEAVSESGGTNERC